MELRKVYVTKRTGFEAAHNLPNYDGKCANIHGHSYKLEATFSGVIDVDLKEGEPSTEAMVCDFSELSKILKQVVGQYDHSMLNGFFTYPTAEVMVVRIFEEIQSKCPSDVKVVSVRLWETETSYAEYKGEIS